MKQAILILCFLSVLFLVKNDCVPSFVRVIREQIKNIDKLKADLLKKKECHTSHTHPICGGGFDYFKEHSKAKYYGPVEKDYMKDFMDIVLSGLKLAPAEFDKVAGALEFMTFSKKVVIAGEDFLFEKAATSSGSGFIQLYSESNCKDPDDAFDALFLNTENSFHLGAEVFVCKSGGGNIFYSETSEEIVYKPASLSRTELDAIRAFMQLSLMSNAKFVLSLIGYDMSGKPL